MIRKPLTLQSLIEDMISSIMWFQGMQEIKDNKSMNSVLVQTTIGSAYEILRILQDHVDIINSMINERGLEPSDYWNNRIEITEAEIDGLKKSLALSTQSGTIPPNPVMNPFDIELCVCTHPKKWHEYSRKDSVDHYGECRFRCHGNCTQYRKADIDKLVVK